MRELAPVVTPLEAAFLALTGALLATIEHTWSRPWVWGSVVVLGVVSGAMSPVAARAFNEVRSAAGLPWFDGKGMRAPQPLDAAALERALAVVARRAWPTFAWGAAGAAVLVWLMTYRPG